MGKNFFIVVVLNSKNIIFKIYIKSILKLIKKIFYYLIKYKQVTILIKDLNYVNIFLFNYKIELLKYTNINNYSINLVDDK